MPRLRPFVEFITLLPFVIPPIILVFGLIHTYSQRPAAADRTRTSAATSCSSAAYVVLSFPYMYRAVDTGLRAIDVRTLTEAAQSLGAGWVTDPVAGHPAEPPGRAPVSGAFLTLAIVIGEFTIATFLARPAFGPYLYAARRRTRPTSRPPSRSSASASPGWRWA